MRASTLIERARSLSDLEGAEFASYADELSFLNEGYRDLYAQITESADDYFIKEVTINLDPSMIVAENEYQLTLPDDVWKLRYVDFNGSGTWVRARKFTMNQKDFTMTGPCYRWYGPKLWFKSVNAGQVRIGYYPPAAVLTAPAASNDLGLSMPPIANLSTVATVVDSYSAVILTAGQPAIRSSNSSAAEVIDVGTDTLSLPLFYKQSLFGLNNTAPAVNELTRYDLDGTTVVATTVLASNVLNYTIQDDVIYYSDGTNTYTLSILGGSPVQIAAEPRYFMYNLGTSSFIYNLGTDVLIDGVTVDSGVSYMSFPLIQKGPHVYRIDDTATYSTSIWHFDQQLSAVYRNLTVVKDSFSGELQVASTVQDTDIIYPLNEANELLAYRMAISFRRKQLADMSSLQARYDEIYQRFMRVLIRDDYSFERIQNYYSSRRWY